MEGRKKGRRDGGAQAPTLGRISGHMLNESSANLKQFMSRQMRVLSSFTPGLGSSTCPASSPLLSVFRLPSPALRSLTFVPPAVCFPPPMFHFLSINCFRCFYRPHPPLLFFPSHFISIFPCVSSLHFLQRRGRPMNNSEALRDDNGKLEVRLCVAGVCGRLADSFQPGGTRKGLFIHIIYVNKTTLLFKVSEHGRVTSNLAAAGRRSDDYGSAVATFPPAAIEPSLKKNSREGVFLEENLIFQFVFLKKTSATFTSPHPAVSHPWKRT